MQKKSIKVIFARPVGFFSLFHQVIEQIILSKIDDSIPIVYFNDTSLFWSPSGYEGRRNVWEYYFYPVSDENIFNFVKIPKERLECADIWEFKNREAHMTLPRKVPEELYGNIYIPDNVYVTNIYTGEIVPYVFDLSNKKRKQLAKVVKDNIKVRESILSKVNHFYEENLKNSNVVGVHIRGREHSDEREFYVKGGHLGIEFYRREIDKYILKNNNVKIYVASDVADNVLELEKIYKERVVSYGAIRLSKEEEEKGLHNKASLDKAMLGEEVLIEALLLSKSDFFVHGTSNVSSASLIFNPNLRHVNIYIKYGKFMSRFRYNLGKRWVQFKSIINKLFPNIYKFIKSIKLG